MKIQTLLLQRFSRADIARVATASALHKAKFTEVSLPNRKIQAKYYNSLILEILVTFPVAMSSVAHT
jgi:hypothetical protein